MLKKIPLIFSFFLIFSCSNALDSSLADGSENASGGSETVAFTGKIGQSSLLSSGAVPSSLLQSSASDSPDSSGSSRSALPKLNSSDFEYYVTASTTSTAVASPIYGTVDAAAKTFTIGLKSGYTWTIEVGMRSSQNSESVFYKDVYKTAISSSSPSVSHDFNLTPCTTGSGSILLTMSCDSSVTKVEAELSDTSKQAAWTAGGVAISNPSGGSCTLTSSDIASGAYAVTLNFFGSGGVLLFSTLQTINVFDNQTTNTWTQGSSSSVISGGNFTLTSALIKSYANTVFYVGATAVSSTSSDSNSGTAYEPLASVGAAISKIENYGSSGSDYKIFVNGTFKEKISITTQNANSITNQKSSDSGATAVLDGDGNGTVVTVNTEVPVTFENITIQNGTCGVYVNSSGLGNTTVKLSDCNVKNNTGGGGIKIFSCGSFVVNGGTISGNTTTGSGGGICITDMPIWVGITDCKIT